MTLGVSIIDGCRRLPQRGRAVTAIGIDSVHR
jgi:hypothetical protein